MSPVKVFFITPTDLYTRSLRRVSFEPMSPCFLARKQHCWASNAAGSIRATTQPTGGCIKWDRKDPLWPEACSACGEPFKDKDWWLVDYHQVYRDQQGDPHIQRKAPPGACWADNYRLEFDGYKAGDDGRCLTVVLPDGMEWCMDGPAYCGGKLVKPYAWTRTGRPENGTLTVSPSIDTGSYHGHLINGHLVSV